MSDTRFSLSFSVNPEVTSKAMDSLVIAMASPLELSLPARKGGERPTVKLDLGPVVKITSPSPGALRVESVDDAFDDMAYAWCMDLSRIPPKTLPRSMRMGVSLLHKLPSANTGNALVDKGRRMVLDQNRRHLAPHLATEVGRRATRILAPFSVPAVSASSDDKSFEDKGQIRKSTL